MAVALVCTACKGETAPGVAGIDGGVLACVDRDGDGYGLNCSLGTDCDDDDAAVTYQCRDCVRPERGCPCSPEQPPQRCFERSLPGEDGTLICEEGTRYCRDGLWSACEDIHSYVASPDTLQAAAVNDGVAPENCDPCRVNCFVVKDPLDDVDGGVVLADGGGLTLPPGDGGAAPMGSGDAGSVVINGGPPAGCVFGMPPDGDCDGIPDAFDELPGAPPLENNDNHAIFFRLGPGDSGLAQLRLAYRVRNADVYFLLDMSTTMSGERDNLIDGLTSGNFYTPLFPPGAAPPCPDLDQDGLPDNELQSLGIIGAIRCLIGGAWIGTGYFRDVPYAPSGHRDEHLFRHLVDMTPDVERVRAALRSMRTNANRDLPEAGALSLWSLATGNGQWFGVDRPAVPQRLEGAVPRGCPLGARGFPCFRDGPVPIVVLFTDDEFANGPAPAPGRGTLNIGAGRNNSAQQAGFTAASAETFDSAHNLGDLTDSYVTLVGDTTAMRSDIPRPIMSCGSDSAAADVVYLFGVGPGGPHPFRFELLDDEDDNTPATDFDMAMALFGGVPGAIGSATAVSPPDATLVTISDGPDRAYLTYVGVTDGAGSQRGYLGGISGCAADGASNQAMFVFTPAFDANIVLDAAASEFASVISLHEGLPSSLPQNPAPTAITNSNDEFDSAAAIQVQNRYLSYVGNSGLSPSLIDADYSESIVGCGANPSAKDSVFTFDLTEPRRVRIDTEGSSIGTVVSLHDGPPPDVDVRDLSGNDALPGHAVGNVRGAFVELRGSTASLSADYAGVCSSDDAAPDAALGFDLDQSTDLELAVSGSGFSPVVALYTALPSELTTVASDDTNDSSASALALGDLHAVEQLRVEPADLSAATLFPDFDSTTVGCGADGAARDAVYSFTVSQDTTVRAQVNAPSWDAVVALFAGPEADPVLPGNRLGCNGNETALEVDVEAGTTYYVVVKAETAAEGPYTLDLRALFRSRSEVDNAAGGNETGEVALALPDAYRSKVVVDAASTSGMTADYAASSCGGSDAAPDAVYRIGASLPTLVDIRVPVRDPAWTPSLSVYRGLPPQAVAVVDLNAESPPNANDDSESAFAAAIAGVGQRVLGNSSGLSHHVHPSLIGPGCGADPTAPDAVFSFSVAEPTEVRIEVPSSDFGAVLGLFAGDVVGTPAALTLENDTVAAADVSPSPSPDVTGDWLRYSADMGNLTISSQTTRSEMVAAPNANSTADNAFDLGDIFGDRVIVGGGDTSTQNNDYLASLLQCGGDDDAPDAVYRFETAQDTSVRIQLTPDAGFDATVALFDGQNGLPRLASETATVVDLNSTAPPNNNESFGMLQGVTIAAEETYLGNTSGMTSDLDGALFDAVGGPQCAAGASAADAFFGFSLGDTTTVEVDSAGSAIATTLSLFDASNLPEPRAAASMENDTRAAAASSPLGVIDGSWPVLTGDMTALTNSATTSSSVTASNTNETGASAQALGDVSARAITVTGGDTASMTNDHVLGCAAAPGARDAVYALSPTSNTTVRISASAGYTPVLALFDAPPDAGFPFAPSNFDPTDSAFDWTSAPPLDFSGGSCGTATFNSSGSGTFSNWCGNPQPAVVIETQGDGSEVAILPMASLNLPSGKTLRLTGSRPVILAVYGDVTIGGTVDASSTASAAGAGANLSCGGAAGGNGSGSSSSGGGGGGGGGFGTAGGSGGYGDSFGNQGDGGGTRGNAVLAPLVGGCRGGSGGGCSSNGGDGGGAFQISARGAVSIGGILRANGEAGSGGCGSEGGGGGGGSGGGILIEGASVTTTGATLQANGGDGGYGNTGGGNGSSSESSSGSGGNNSGSNGGGGGGGGYGRVHENIGGSGGSANQLACGASQIEFPLDAGQTYYLVVKGNNDGDDGPYSLKLEAPAASMGCGEDRYAADAYFEFSLSSAASVTLDTSGSDLDTVLALYDAADSLLECDDDGAGGGDSRLTRSLAAGTYYAVIRPKDGTPEDRTYRLSIRDDDGLGALACADGAASTGASLSQTLPAGSYVLGVTGQGSASGAYRLRFRNADSGYATWMACGDTTLSAPVQAGRPYYVVVKGDAAAQSGAYQLEVQSAGAAPNLGCGDDPGSPDAFYRFTLSEETRVRIDTEGSQLDTVVGLFPAGTAVFDPSSYAIDADGDPVPCDDDGAGNGDSLIDAELVPGAYYVVVKGKQAAWSGADLPFNLSIRDEGTLGALACAAPGGSIVQTVQPGDYSVVLSSDSAAGGDYALRLANEDAITSQNGSEVACATGTELTGVELLLGEDYYLVVKGDQAGDAGDHQVIVEDAVSLSGATGDEPIACLDDSTPLATNLPPGSYYALVKGATGAGDYTLQIRDTVALEDANRLACDDDSGPDDTSVIEADLVPGSYWVVVKGDGPADVGSYQLNVRDLQTYDDRRLACAGTAQGSRIETSVVAGQDYTLILKGQDGGQGDYNMKLYDADNLMLGMGENLGCTNNNGALNANLSEGTYYLALKGQRLDDRGVYQLDIRDTSGASTSSSTYTPPDWASAGGTREALQQAGIVVLPVMSGTPGDALDQAEDIASATGAVTASGVPIVKEINRNGNGLGADLVEAINELANNLALDVGVRAVWEPDDPMPRFDVDIVAVAGSPGCDPAPNPAGPSPAGVQRNCVPGSTPQFDITFTNPGVPNNPTDPFGGYHFRLELVGTNSSSGTGTQYVLDAVPVYIVPDLTAGPPAPGSVQPSGSFTRDVVASGCSHFLAEGEGTGDGSCEDGIDNDGDGLIDRGLSAGADGGMEAPPDPDCMPGTCGDGIDNDGDGDIDAEDTTCLTNLQMPDWTDLYFHASIPPGARVIFEACTAATEDELDSCSFGTLATVVSNGNTCASAGDCLSMTVDGMTRDGYCAQDGSCQFLDPLTARPSCTNDSQCDNGDYQGFEVRSTCQSNECIYTTVPADVAAGLPDGSNFLPYLRSRITLQADPSNAASPVLYDFWVTYNCTTVN